MIRSPKWMVAVGVAVSLFTSPRARSCIWDSDTLDQEKVSSPQLAGAVLGGGAKPPDPKPLLERITKLKAAPQEDDPAWWNDLAGAYLRLGRAQEAADLLEPVVERFPQDYGVHANLGTAYHLLGRYPEAAKEIARDLEIDPDAHFGLEKYHLALLRYLTKDREYQKNHLYVDAWTQTFLNRDVLRPNVHVSPYAGARRVKTPELWLAELKKMRPLESNTTTPDSASSQETSDEIAQLEAQIDDPDFRLQWSLADDQKLSDGVIYMVSLNSREPACHAMLGMVCLLNRDLNLAVGAFQHAIDLKSPQEVELKTMIKAIRSHQAQDRAQLRESIMVLSFFTMGVVCAVLVAAKLVRRARARNNL